MTLKRVAQAVCALMLLAFCAFGQVTTGNIMGTVTDPGDASVPNVEVQLRNQATGETRNFTTGSEGIFRFNNVAPGNYTVTLKAQSGFKAYTQQGIALSGGETRDLGRIALALGSLTEEVSVTAVATPIQTASSEKSSLVDGNQLKEIALKSRDMMAMLSLLPGVTSTSVQDVTSEGSIGGVTINGNGGTKNNFLVDGVTNLDTGSNSTSHYNPNMDAVAEIRVLTTNYQAEYGRMMGGQIAVVTKGGSQEFHGSAWEIKRHEMFNAKSFFQNYNNQPKSLYRYNVYGFSVGGPIYIPKLFNTEKKRFFFFVSQEYTKQRPSTSYNYYNLPTTLERAGDFSQSKDNNGNMIVLYDPNIPAPNTRVPIPGNVITPAYIKDQSSAAAGQSILSFFPLPNLCGRPGVGTNCKVDSDASQLTRRNYLNTWSGSHPRRNDVLRIDANVTSKLTTWWRYVNDYDMEETGSNMQFKNAQGSWETYYEDHPNPGRGQGIGITYTISPTMVNEFTFGKSYNTWDYYVHNESLVDRAKMANPPSWNDFKNDPAFKADGNLARPTQGPGAQNFAVYIPQVNFGAPNSTQSGFSTSRPYTNWNDIYTVNDSLSYVRGTHSFKAGFYYERTGKVQQGGTGAYLGQYNFGNSSSFPSDTNNGFANAYVGQFQNYQEGKRVIGDFWFTGIEFFVQDNWRISRRLTLDVGMRFYHLWPQENLNGNSAVFVPSTYDSSVTPRLYYPGLATGNYPGFKTGAQVAVDRLTGYETFPALNGTFVPYSVGGYAKQPNYFNGMQVADGKNPNLPLSLFSPPQLSPALRIGLAWDVFGNGKTAVRTGFGQGYNRGDGNQIMGYNGQPPVAYNRVVYYTSMGAVPGYANSAAVNPIAPGEIVGKQKYEATMNGSFGLQQSVGFSTVVDASYVFNLRRHTVLTRRLNAQPMFSEYNPAYYNPWNANLAPGQSNKNIGANYFRPNYPGLGDLSWNNFEGSNNYHSFQMQIRRSMSRGLSYGLAYTFHKMTGINGASPYWPDKFRNYGPSFQGAPHVLSFNYIYSLPGLAKHYNIRALGWVTDNWTLSGITQWQSHGVRGIPGWSFSNTSTANPGPNMTGSYEGARMISLGSLEIPADQVKFSGGSGTDGNYTFNWKNLGIPTPCYINQSLSCFGNIGTGDLMKVPTWMNNWDVTLAKRFPIKGERRELVFRAEFYNIFNHTQFSGLDTNIQYHVGDWQKGILTQTNKTLGRFTSARNPRQMAMSLRLQF